MLDEFVRGLGEGYETILGGSGIGLSGGQCQRLTLARVWLRDPAVLILGIFSFFFRQLVIRADDRVYIDGPTSASDVASRVRVFEALKARRRHKTTVVITHDLAQINQEDFVHVIKEGRVVEQEGLWVIVRGWTT